MLFFLAICFRRVQTQFILLQSTQRIHLFHGKSKILKESCSLTCNEAITYRQKSDPRNDWPVCLWNISEVKYKLWNNYQSKSMYLPFSWKFGRLCISKFREKNMRSILNTNVILI